MRGALAVARKEHWAEARLWLYCTLGVGCLPFWGIAFLYWLYAQRVGLDMFVGQAQLAVYAAGLFAPAMPVIIRDIKDSPFKQPKWFLIASVVAVMFAAFTFAAVVTRPGISIVRLAIPSFGIFLLAIVLGFFVELINNIRSDPDIIALKRQQVDDLSAQVRKAFGDWSSVISRSTWVSNGH